MSLNRAAYQALGSPAAVILMFDHASRAIGMKPTDLSVRHAYPIRRQPNSDSYVLAGQAFCNFYEIDSQQTKAFEPEVEDGVLVFELAKGIVVDRKRGRSLPPRGPQQSLALDEEPNAGIQA